jgi:hypothetical protein
MILVHTDTAVMDFIPAGDTSVNSCFLVLRCFVDMSLANSGLGTVQQTQDFTLCSFNPCNWH